MNDWCQQHKATGAHGMYKALVSTNVPNGKIVLSPPHSVNHQMFETPLNQSLPPPSVVTPSDVRFNAPTSLSLPTAAGCHLHVPFFFLFISSPFPPTPSTDRTVNTSKRATATTMSKARASCGRKGSNYQNLLDLARYVERQCT